jgi:exosortase
MNKDAPKPVFPFPTLRWQPLSGECRSALGFWAIAGAFLFYLFHIHGCDQDKFHSLFYWLWARWNGDYAYCAFLPLASLAALWIKRREIATAPRAVSWWGALPVVFGLFLHWLGVLVQHPRISTVGFIVLLWGIPFLLHGRRVAALTLFPAAYLLLCVPLNFIDSMTSPLRIFAAHASAVVLNGFGLHVIQDGAGLHSATDNAFSFNVAPECSGLHSLLAMTALIAFYAWLTQKTLGKKWLLFLCSIPVAIVANVFRIILVVVVAAIWDQDTAMGLWHDYSGYPVFLVGILLMLALDRLFNADWHALWKKLANRFFSPVSS